ncbi:MAG: hypothetical protein KJ047_00925 [Anaerolineae bacterium]|nr:hypothetical protein [Anaerolineae bacterium]MEB2287588.1 hypothetical protein [Anaerolineae bacterium]
MQTTHEQIGRVIRVGRGWADVSVERRIVRVITNPGFLVQPGAQLKIVGNRAVSLAEGEQRGPAGAAH